MRVDNLARSDLYIAEEIFVCGTAAEVSSVNSVDDRAVPCPGPMTKAIADVYARTVRGQEAKYTRLVRARGLTRTGRPRRHLYSSADEHSRLHRHRRREPGEGHRHRGARSPASSSSRGSSEWDAVAERGNKVANALAGALAQYFKVGVLVRTAPDGNGVIRLDKSSKGYMGGAVGAHRTTKNFDALAADLEATFRAAGVLVHAQQL